MTAEETAKTLRSAACRMRTDWEVRGLPTPEFWSKVADLLEEAAIYGECEHCGHDIFRCTEFATLRPLKWDCCPDCEHASRAEAVAAAYLEWPWGSK